MKMPRLVTDRDFVQYTTTKTDKENADTTIILYKNATHRRQPVRRGVLRCVQNIK